MVAGQGVGSDRRDDEVRRRDLGALVQMLEEGMLAVGAGVRPRSPGQSDTASAFPERSTCLPLLSMSSCCRKAGR